MYVVLKLRSAERCSVLEADEALTLCATRVPSYDVLLLSLFMLLVHYDKKPLLAGDLPLLVDLIEDVV